MWASENHATSGSHVRLPPGTVVGSAYEVVGEAGSGNFARVYECRDIRNGARVAIKFMKQGYERDADFEVDVLSSVNKNDPSDSSGLVRFIERISFQGYAGLVFSLKGKALRASRLPMSKEDIKAVIRDIAAALHFLHRTCRAVHTDLKPENILAEMPGSSRAWCICDFGSSSFYGTTLDNDLITTRPYRAPEVVMKRGWTYHADTWSLGCIVYELFTGRKLFDAQSDGEHLEVMQSRLGPIPAQLCPPRLNTISRSRLPLLKEELRNEPELLNLLELMLRYDPNERIHCGEILKHPFLAGGASLRPPAPVAPPAPINRLATISASATNVQAPLGAKPAAAPQYTAASQYRTSSQQYGALPHPSTFPKAGPQLFSPAVPTYFGGR